MPYSVESVEVLRSIRTEGLSSRETILYQGELETRNLCTDERHTSSLMANADGNAKHFVTHDRSTRCDGPGVVVLATDGTRTDVLSVGATKRNHDARTAVRKHVKSTGRAFRDHLAECSEDGTTWQVWVKTDDRHECLRVGLGRRQEPT